MTVASPDLTRATSLHYRSCTLCEAMCGLEVQHADGEVLAIRGDEHNHFSRGHICPKGNALQDIHVDPERIRFPLKRTAGGWERVDWDEALDDVATRVLAIQRDHGRDAVALYAGNPTVHHLGAMLMIGPVIAALGTRNRYSATSLDQLPHMLAAWKLFGHQLLLPVPDIDRTQFFLCLGGNPMASNGSLMTAPGIRHRIRALQARGGRFVVVDPRRTETAAIANEHFFIRPGTDAWLLLAMLHVIFDEGLATPGRTAAFLDGLDELAHHLEEFTPTRAEAVTAVPAGEIRRLGRELATAPRAIAYGRVGVCTQEFGGLAAWLVYVLNIVTGNLDREGGLMFSSPAVDPLPLTAAAGLGGSFDRYRSRVSGLPEFSGELPTAALAEEIETPGDGQVRGLLVHAGNPVLSAPNGARLELALPSLELMVCFDFYLNETTRHADYILPPASPLETVEYDIALSLLAVRNVAHYSPALFEPPPDTRHDWEALAGLATRLLRGRGFRGRITAAALQATVKGLGADGLLDLVLRLGPYGHAAGASALVDRALGHTGPFRGVWRRALALAGSGPWGRAVPPLDGALPESVPAAGLTLKTLKAHPHGLDLGSLVPRLPERLFTPGKRIKLVHDLYLADLERLRGGHDGSSEPRNGLVLIGRRHLRSNNSWMHNSRRLVKGKSRCTLMMHPADAADRGLEEGATAVVSSRAGEVHLAVEITEALMPGVVSIPHGWGHHRDGVGWSTAQAHAGVSVNDVTDEKHVDGLSGTAAFNGVPVKVRAATGSA
jgi:anaerobic selenocysteine-containing dehydrogenase